MVRERRFFIFKPAENSRRVEESQPPFESYVIAFIYQTRHRKERR